MKTVAIGPAERVLIGPASDSEVDETISKIQLDFIQIVAKTFSFSCIKEVTSEERFLFHSNHWWKPFPHKFFSSFNSKGHSFFLGSASSYNIYFLFENKDSYCSCDCSNKGCVSKEVADFISKKVVRPIFERYYPTDNSIRIQDRQTNHLVMVDEFDNFDQHATWSFAMDSLQTSSVCDTMSTLWDYLEADEMETEVFKTFVQEHKPRIVFSDFGQNTELPLENVGEFVSNRFRLNEVENTSLSLAVNIWKDGVSLVMSEDRIRQMFRHISDVEIYRKGFHSQFSNFNCTQAVPNSLASLNDSTSDFERTVVGFHGYSDVANVLRRNAASEPFSSRPISSYFEVAYPMNNNEVAVSFKESLEKIKRQIQEQKSNLVHGVLDKERNGTSYRFEVTVKYDLHSLVGFERLQNDLNQFTSQVKQWVLINCAPSLKAVQTNVFPKILRVYVESIYETVDKFVERYKLTPTSITAWDKEYMAFCECLLRQTINGNSKRNLSHRLFSILGIKDSINSFNMPFFDQSNYDENLDTFNPIEVLTARPTISLHLSQVGCLVGETTRVLARALLLKMECETNFSEEVVKLYFYKCLEFLKRDLHFLVQDKAKKSNAFQLLPQDLKKNLTKVNLDIFLMYLARNQSFFNQTNPLRIDKLYDSLVGINEEIALPFRCFNSKKPLYYLRTLSHFVRLILLNNPHSHTVKLKKYFSNFLNGIQFLPDVVHGNWNEKLVVVCWDDEIQTTELQRDGRSSRVQRVDLLNLTSKEKTYFPGGPWKSEFSKDFLPIFKTFWQDKFGKKLPYFGSLENVPKEIEVILLLSLIGSAHQTEITSLDKPRQRGNWAAAYFAKGLLHCGKIESVNVKVKKAISNNCITERLITRSMPNSITEFDRARKIMIQGKNSENYFQEVFFRD